MSALSGVATSPEANIPGRDEWVDLDVGIRKIAKVVTGLQKMHRALDSGKES